MISAVDNNKNQYFERVGAVSMQAQRGYPPEFLQDLQKKTGGYATGRVDKTFGSLLTYGRSNAKSANPFDGIGSKEFNLSHPNVKDENTAQKFDFIA
ncbi:MAG: hypothetical protein NC390_04330 [Fusobacterium sp.]|nr:hypothetical protein [Fusobacterium sp.]